MKPVPKSIRTAPALAKVIAQKFDVRCDRLVIKHWQKAGFPKADENNAYDTAACFAWVEKKERAKSIGKKGLVDQGMLALDTEAYKARQQKHITAAQRDQFELDKEMGKLINREVAEHTIRTAMKSYHGFAKQEVEQNSPASRRDKLSELGASKDIVALFYAWDLEQSQKTIDRIENRCEEGFYE